MKNSKKLIKFLSKSRLSLILFIEILVSLFISLGSLYLFLKIGHEALDKDILVIDSGIINYIYSFRSPAMNNIMMFFTSLGSGLSLILLSTIMILYIGTIRKKDVGIYLAILYSGILLNAILKFTYQRPRPDYLPLIHETSSSFPSGHSMNSFVFFAAFSYFILRETKNTKLTVIISILSTIIIILIGISRIYLGAHYPSDVIGGFIAGFLLFTSAILFEKIIIFKRLYKSSKK